MGRSNKTSKGSPVVPAPQRKRKDPGVPKFAAAAVKKEERKVAQKLAEKERWREKARAHNPQSQQVRSFANISTTSTPYDVDAEARAAAASTSTTDHIPLDASIMLKDSSAKAFMTHLRRVIDQSDVIIQVLDARDPLGGRSKFVEEEVRRREGDGKKLIGVINKIDLVPRPAVEQWLRYLRHDFPTLPFKSSTQQQRQHISSMHLPTAAAGQAAPETTPVTALALGAAPLIQLLKSYARHLPTGQSLTVGVVGFPNVGKSSLINSLKRSRACGVAATPGKTRVVQEIALDKGVKILDCPGIVFDPASEDPSMGEEAKRKKRGEVILRNCVKAELVEDVFSPVEIIITKVDHAQLEKLYSVPPFENVNQLLVSIALVRGRLGKGGVPDLESSAVQVLRDWNTGKIAYYTTPPAVHPSSLLQPLHRKAPEYLQQQQEGSADMDVSSAGPAGVTLGSGSGTATGDAAIVKSFAPAFDMGDLFGQADREVFEDLDAAVNGGDGEMDVEGESRVADKANEITYDNDEDTGGEAWGGMEDYIGMGVLKPEDEEVVVRKMAEDHNPRPPPVAAASKISYPDTVAFKSKTTSMARLFAPEEITNMSMANPLSRKNLKAEKKRKERELRRLMDGGNGLDDDAGDDSMDY